MSDAITMDHRLAQEMLHLLGKELLMVRARVQTLESFEKRVRQLESIQKENDTLKNELNLLNARVQDPKHAILQNVFAKTSQEFELPISRLRQLLNLSLQGIQISTQLNQSLERCKLLEGQNQLLKNSVKSLQEQLDKAATVHSEVTPQAGLSTSEAQGAGQFDLTAFLQNPPRTADFVNPSSGPVLARKSKLKAVRKANVEVWDCSRGFALGNSSAGLKLAFEVKNVGDTKPLFIHDNSTKMIYYCGDYKCTQMVSVGPKYAYTLKESFNNGLRSLATLNRKAIPQLMIDMVEGLYDAGALRVQCAVLECIGVDRELQSQTQHDKATGTLPISAIGAKLGTDNKLPDGVEVHKRKREGSDDQNMLPSKKICEVEASIKIDSPSRVGT